MPAFFPFYGSILIWLNLVLFERAILILLLTSELYFFPSRSITITMPTGGDLEVSAEEANQAVVVAPTTGDPGGGLPPLLPLKKIWDCSKVEKGPTVPKR